MEIKTNWSIYEKDEKKYTEKINDTTDLVLFFPFIPLTHFLVSLEFIQFAEVIKYWSTSVLVNGAIIALVCTKTKKKKES